MDRINKPYCCNLKPLIKKPFAGKVYSVLVKNLNRDVREGMLSEVAMKGERGLYFLEKLFDKTHISRGIGPEIESMRFVFEFCNVFFSTNGEKIHIHCTNFNGDLIDITNNVRDLIESKFGVKLSRAQRELIF